MPALPLSYWTTGQPIVTQTDIGIEVTIAISINDADGRPVEKNARVTFAYPAGLKDQATKDTAFASAAKAAADGYVADLEAKLTSEDEIKTTFVNVADQIQS